MRSSPWCCVLLFVGCTSVRHIHLPEGARGRMVACSGAARDWGDCMNGAHRVCDGKYRIVERYEERGACTRATDDAAAASPGTRERKMLVVCAR